MLASTALLNGWQAWQCVPNKILVKNETSNPDGIKVELFLAYSIGTLKDTAIHYFVRKQDIYSVFIQKGQEIDIATLLPKITPDTTEPFINKFKIGFGLVPAELRERGDIILTPIDLGDHYLAHSKIRIKVRGNKKFKIEHLPGSHKEYIKAPQ